jgi:serine protease Do
VRSTLRAFQAKGGCHLFGESTTFSAFPLSVTAGILSAKSRSLPTARQQEFMQTDAAINPGSSGGPLVNLRGEVIGINAAIETTSGVYAGVGFAIPVNRAKWISQQLAQQGTVRRAYLGVGVQELTPALSRKLETPAGRGLVVAEVRPNSPAALAGVRLGDVITRFAGHPVASWAVFNTAIERVAIDSRQQLGLVREGKPLELPVTMCAEPREGARD